MGNEIDGTVGPLLQQERFSADNPDWDQSCLTQEALDAMNSGMSAEGASVISGAAIVALALSQERPSGPSPQ
jgi:hypothetical protein